MVNLAAVVLCIYLVHFACGLSKGNPLPSMLKGKMAKMRIMTSHNALKERATGNHKRFKPGVDANKGHVEVQSVVFQPVLPTVPVCESVGIYMRKAQSNSWLKTKQVFLNEDESMFKLDVLKNNNPSNQIQRKFDKMLLGKLFGKGLGEPDFVADARKQHAELANVKIEQIEYGYKLDEGSQVSVLENLRSKKPPPKVQRVPLISLETLLLVASRKTQQVICPADLETGVDALLQAIDTMSSPRLLVCFDGSADFGLWDRKTEVCVAAGAGITLTAYDRHELANSDGISGEERVHSPPHSLLVRVSNLHCLTAPPARPELIPGLVALVITAHLLDRYTQRQLPLPSGLTVQLVGNVKQYLDSVRSDRQIDPTAAEMTCNERNQLTMHQLAQELYHNQTLTVPEVGAGATHTHLKQVKVPLETTLAPLLKMKEPPSR